MKIRNAKIKRLLEKYKEISLLAKINSTLMWDLNVNLPPKASYGRADQSAYITKLISEKWLDKDLVNLIDATGSSDDLNNDEKAIIKNLNHSGNYYWKVPKHVIVEFAETTSKAFMSWQLAKKDNKFNQFFA